MAQLAGVTRQFVQAAMAAPFLARDEEHDLAIRWRDNRDEKAMHQLAHAHMRLVIALAMRFRRYELPVADLIQEGHIGLLEAAARFDPDRDVRFSTYATWWIRASMQDYVLRNWSIVRGGTSSAQKALFFNLRRLRMRLMRDPEPGESQRIFTAIGEMFGVSTADVETMDARLSGSDVSLNAPISTGEASTAADRMDMLVDDKPWPDQIVEESIDSDRRIVWLQDALHVLSERELNILKERRLAEESATLEALGVRLGISKERVRQIENRAVEKLRLAMIRQHPQELRYALA